MTKEDPKLPPSDSAAERTLLGLALQSEQALSRAAEVVCGPYFYETKHNLIWNAMLNLSKDANGVDIVTVADALERAHLLPKAGGRTYLAELITEMPVVAGMDIQRYAEIVRECWRLRNLIRLAYDTSEQAYGRTDSEILAGMLERSLFELMWSGRSSEWKTSREVSLQTMEYIDTIQSRQAELLGIPTGLNELDRILGGWQRSDLVIIGARPSMGKTALAAGAALAASRYGAKVGMISLEMSALQLGLRFLSMGAGVNISALRQGRVANSSDWKRLAGASGCFENASIWIDDGAVMTVDQVRAKARQLKIREGLDVLIVDYLQLVDMGSKNQNRAQQVADASRALKVLAKELDITVLGLSQVSRECERRDDKRPTLSDLRESGALEQDADVVIFLYREEFYDPIQAAENGLAGLAEILVRKHRNGPTEDFRVAWVKERATFQDLDGNDSKRPHAGTAPISLGGVS
jgi:replicative DNA helicase